MIIKLNSKRGVVPFVAIGVFLALALILFASKTIPTGGLFGGNDYIEAPYFATLSCEQSGTSKTYSGDIDQDGEWISDRLPKNTNEWSILLNENGGKLGYSEPWFEYYICPQRQILNNCVHVDNVNNKGPTSLTLPSVSSDQHIWVQKQANLIVVRKGLSGGSYVVTYKPFQLIRQDIFRGGTQPVGGAIGCQVPYTDPSWQNRVLSAVGLDVDIATTRDLRPGENFNYVSGTVTRLAEGNTQDGGYCIYENGQGKIYPISQLTTASNSYNVVDITRSPIKNVQCCNGDNLPDQTCVNGNWQSTQNAECSFINPCEGNEWRPNLNNDDQIIRYECVQGICEAKTKDVDCTIDSQCATNQRCNLNSFTCEDASIVGGPGEERIPTDQISCEEMGWDWIPEETKRTGLFGIYGQTRIVEAHCEKPDTLKTLLIIGLIALAVFVFIIIRPYITGWLRAIRMFLKSLPFVGGFFP